MQKQIVLRFAQNGARLAASWEPFWMPIGRMPFWNTVSAFGSRSQSTPQNCWLASSLVALTLTPLLTQ